MRMIHIAFNNAGYFPQCKNTPKNWQYSESDGKYIHAEIGSRNYAEPVTVNIVANVLRALAGDVPVPTLKPNGIEKNPIYEEIASNSFVKYATPMVDEKGKPVLMESLNLNKAHVPNSNSKATQTFTLFDGSTYVAKGSYNWHYFDETFSNDNKLNNESIIEFIESILNVENIRKYTFEEVVKMLSQYWNTPEFDEKVECFLIENYTLNAINGPWCYIFFGCVFENGKIVHKIPTASNSFYKSKTPLLYTKGIGQVKHIDGDIYCPVSDEMLECIRNNAGTATILDGGLAYIVGIENYDEEGLEIHGYHKILTREQALTA